MLDQETVARIHLYEKWKAQYRETGSADAEKLFSNFYQICQSAPLNQLSYFDEVAMMYAVYCDGSPEFARSTAVALQFVLDRYGIIDQYRKYVSYYKYGVELRLAQEFIRFLFPSDSRRRINLQNFLKGMRNDAPQKPIS